LWQQNTITAAADAAAAAPAENKKREKYMYVELAKSGDFVFAPIAIETLGAWGFSALEITADISGRVTRNTEDVRSSAFLRQRLDIAIQKGNAEAVHGNMPV
jgi:hypothetical protein